MAASNVIVNKWLDLADRVGWTGIQAAIAALAAYLITDGIGWEEGGIFVGTAVVAAIAKVLIGQSGLSGGDATGSLIGQRVIEAEAPAPRPATTVKK